MFRMAPKSLGLWMLFLWIQKGDCGNYTGILGEDTDLKCCYHGGDLKSDPFRVQWQLKGNVDCVVDAYLPDQPAPPQCEHYKNRTVLNKDCLHLQLLNLSLEDSKIYECILQKKVQNKYQKVFQGQIELKVAANNSTNAIKGLDSTSTSNPVKNDNQQQTRVVAISCVIAAAVFITVIILILYKRKYSIHRAYTAPVGVEMT
ncbi:uncharacterized protein LOC125431915 isoform X2 [Sphaerodactylus townsendi]|uniref:uncharacterized protein LOC125431915 isoform X2 n=1 Tax=Sphaerodactylus townsendi TaxID=933632 RepID=UPI002026A277|nr:uncharacterized protein LOC125431915 isoform X2 [Sphaerodactylus townsendi]